MIFLCDDWKQEQSPNWPVHTRAYTLTLGSVLAVQHFNVMSQFEAVLSRSLLRDVNPSPAVRNLRAAYLDLIIPCACIPEWGWVSCHPKPNGSIPCVKNSGFIERLGPMNLRFPNISDMSVVNLQGLCYSEQLLQGVAGCQSCSYWFRVEAASKSQRFRFLDTGSALPRSLCRSVSASVQLEEVWRRSVRSGVCHDWNGPKTSWQTLGLCHADDKSSTHIDGNAMKVLKHAKTRS